MYTLNTFIDTLTQADIRPTVNELADTLWLAKQMRTRHKTFPQRENTQSLQFQETAKPRFDSKDTSLHKEQVEQGKSQTHHQTSVPIYPQTGRSSGIPATTMRVPAVPMLPDRLNLGRSLRPLRRKIFSTRRKIIDEVASINHIAETRLWQVQLKGCTERCYELVLIIDYSEAMQIWGPTLKELQRLLECQGAFRSLRVWYLDGDNESQEAALLYSHADFTHARRCQPKELFDPRGRRLVWVLSDCTAAAWHNGTAFQLLSKWSQKLPVALLQMLPEHLWPNTALGYADKTQYYAQGIPSNNQALMGDSLIIATDTRNELRLPVLTLEAMPFGYWAMLMDGRGSWVKGSYFDDLEAIIKEAEEEYGAEEQVELNDEQRFYGFLSYASMGARRLAAHLAAVPLTLPVMRLVQQRLVPGPLSELAEFFLSPLIKTRVSHADPMQREYDFHGELRTRLLNTMDIASSMQVLQEVSGYLSDKLGKSVDFYALLQNPQAAEAVYLDEKTQHFAEISALVLRQYGGKFAQLADILSGQSNVEHDETILAGDLVDGSMEVSDEEKPFATLNTLKGTEPVLLIMVHEKDVDLAHEISDVFKKHEYLTSISIQSSDMSNTLSSIEACNSILIIYYHSPLTWVREYILRLHWLAAQIKSKDMSSFRILIIDMNESSIYMKLPSVFQLVNCRGINAPEIVIRTAHLLKLEKVY